MQKGLILALDLVKKSEILNVLSKVKNYIDYLKINYPPVLTLGVDIIKEVSEIKPTIADFKIADIKEISEKIAKIAFENGAKGIIIHGIIGSSAIKSVLNVSKRYNGEVYVLTDLTRTNFRFPSYKIAKMAKRLNCHGVVVPGNKPWKIKRIRKIIGKLKILTPGIGFQGGDPLEALNAGADYIIVGRSIYLAKDPEKAAKEFRSFLKN